MTDMDNYPIIYQTKNQLSWEESGRGMCDICHQHSIGHLMEVEPITYDQIPKTEFVRYLQAHKVKYHVYGGYFHPGFDGFIIWFVDKPCESEVCVRCFRGIVKRVPCLITFYMFWGNDPRTFEEVKIEIQKIFPLAVLEWSIQKLMLEDQKAYIQECQRKARRAGGGAG